MSEFTEAEIKIDDQWFVRGNRSPLWLACASRTDGSRSGICEKVPPEFWPFLDAIAELRAENARLRKALLNIEQLAQFIPGANYIREIANQVTTHKEG